MRRVMYIAVSVILSLSFIVAGLLFFRTSYTRFFETLVDLWHSLRYYFCELFDIEFIGDVTVQRYSDVMIWEVKLPVDWPTFKEMVKRYTELFFSKETLNGYLKLLLLVIAKGTKMLILAIPLLILFATVIKQLYRKENTDHNKDTRPLKLYKRIRGVLYYPIRNALLRFSRFLRNNRFIPIFWVILWVFHLNLSSIAVAFFAYCFYLVMSFDLISIYVQVCKLAIDLQVFFRTVPLWILIPLTLALFERLRRSIAQNKLHHMEARNCGFIRELPIVSLTCGSMGKKKTTVISDMALSQEVMFRQKAFELLKKSDMKFPEFPWIAFEMQIRRCMEHGEIYNLAGIKEWIHKKRQRYERHFNSRLQLYGYRTDLYGIVYDNGVITEDIFDVLESYAKLYFIYVIESSLMVANYSIRTDHELMDSGNFPIWAQDFFPELTCEEGRHAHILDFDVLRLGRKVIENNPNSGSFEFGIVVLSEVGKERGNILDHKEMKKGNEEANQKNDLFNFWLKMCRHSATVDHYPFIKVFADEQRPESWGADARDLCDILNIVSTGEENVAFPFYTIEETVYELLYERFMRLYYRFRYRRGDNTLLVYLLKTVVSWLYNRNVRIRNRYGYCVARIEKRRGTMDGKIKRQKYYLMNKKIYARRFSTDCFSDYFNDMALRSEVGLMDYPEYETERASVEELRYQNSYFINALYRDASSE